MSVYGQLSRVLHLGLVRRVGARYVLATTGPELAEAPQAAPLAQAPPPPELRQVGDQVFEIVPYPSASGFLGSSLGPRRSR